MDSRLYKAITTEDVNGLRQLIANDDDLLLQMTPLNNTALHVAVQFDSKLCVREILNKCPALLLQQNLKGNNPLHIAAMLGSSEIVASLILHASIIQQAGGIQGGTGGSSATVLQQLVRMSNKENDTALHEAVRHHRFEVVLSLTEADPVFEYFPNNAGETPLYIAAEAGLYRFVAQILEKCPTSAHNGPRGLSALHVGAMNGYSDITRLLLEKKSGTIIKEVDENGCSALHYAAYFRRAKMVVQLLKADPASGNMTDKDGKTALHIAANNIMPRSVAYISDTEGITLHKVMNHAFSGSVYPKEFERYGMTTTYCYDYDEKFKKRSAEVIKEVSNLCPESLELSDKNGQNFLHVAAESGQFFILEYALLKLKIAEVLINEKDDNGNTPLHLVLKSGSYGCLGILSKDDRVNKRAINKNNLSAADMALNNLDKAHGSYWEFHRTAYERLSKAPGSYWANQYLSRAQGMWSRPITWLPTKSKFRKGSYVWNGRRLIKEEEERHKAIMHDADGDSISKEEREALEKLSQTHMLVATLIGTVTFAAGLTLPGGFNNDEPGKGMAILIDKPAFLAFAVSNSIAMILSTMVVFIHFMSKLIYINDYPVRHTIFMIHLLMFLALIALLVAFATGSYTVLGAPWAIITSIMILIIFNVLMSLSAKTYAFAFRYASVICVLCLLYVIFLCRFLPANLSFCHSWSRSPSMTTML